MFHTKMTLSHTHQAQCQNPICLAIWLQFIWEKGGIPYLTLGISRWNNDISVSKDKKHHMAAFNGKNEMVPYFV